MNLEKGKLNNPKLENWSVCGALKDPYTAPELAVTVLHGNVYGHSRFDDGTSITTSVLKYIDVTKKEARTNNTFYTLGEPDPKFVAYVEKNGYKLEDYNNKLTDK